MANYTYVVDSNYQPFSMQEMLVPFTAYKEAYEKADTEYDDLKDKADNFKYLAKNLPEGSEARQIYEGYANDLNKQAEDFSNNGLTMNNRRALSSMRKRYSGEIGRLVKADEALKEEQKLRRSINAQDPSRLYATDNLSIDDYLDGKSPNLYSISGNELYAKGAEIGKAISSRVVNVGEGNITLGGYYRDLVSKYGYGQELLNRFKKDMNVIPELKDAYEGYMEASGVNQNLKGYSRDRATQYFIQGMLNDAVYQENHNIQRDLGVLTAAEKASQDLAEKNYQLEKDKYNLEVLKEQNKNNTGGGNKYPGYTKIQYVPGNGSIPKNVDRVSSKATQVYIETDVAKGKDGKPITIYNVYAGDPYGNEDNGTKLLLGTMDAYGDFTLGKDIDPRNDKGDSTAEKHFKKFFKNGNSWWDKSDVYDPAYDVANIKKLLKDVITIESKEGGGSYNNYNYYLEPDNAGWNNESGGFFREPMNRVAGTNFNQDYSNFKGGL